MKRRFRKMISMLLAAAMVLSMGLTGLAAEIEPLASSPSVTGSITINDAVNGEIYTIYKMFDLTYTDYDTEDEDEEASPDSYSYKVVNDWQGFFAAGGAGASYITVNADGYVTAVSFEADSPDSAAFAQAALAYAKANSISETSNATASGGTVVFEGLNLGYYLVDTSLGSLCMLTSTDPDAEIYEKNSVPSVEKLVDYGEEESIENNRKVNYEIKVDDIKGVSQLVIHDKMDTTATYTFDYTSLVVQLVDGTTTTTLTKDTDYVVVIGPLDDDIDNSLGACDFHIVFTVDNVDYDFSGCSDDAYIQATIDCTIDASGLQFADDEIEIPNLAKITYGNSGESEWSEADIYEYGFEIFKYTGTDTALANASFQLSKTSTSEDSEEDTSTLYAIFDYSSTYDEYVFTGWTEDSTKATTMTTTSTGILYVDGLAEGTYILTETAAPDGYNILLSPITVNITVNTDDPKVFTVSYSYTLADGTTISGSSGSSANHRINVLNNSGTILPGTGGMGTTIFYIVGIVLMIGAAAFFIARKRISKEE